MTSGPWYIAEWVAVCVIQVWTWAGITLRLGDDSRWVRVLHSELRPFYWPAVLLAYTCAVVRFRHPLDPTNLACLGVSAAGWFLLKDAGGDDDRWKRRKARLVEKVSQVGGRLVVEPAGAES